MMSNPNSASKGAMNFHIRRGVHVTEVALSGRMTFGDHDRFRELITAFEGPSGHQMVFDLSKVDFVDSSGLGMLLIARDVAESKQLNLTLKAPQKEVRQLMELAKFNRVIPITE